MEYNKREVVFASEADAEDVAAQLMDILVENDVLTMLDLYEILAMGVVNAELENWGWTMMSDIRVAQINDGYILDLPNPAKL